MEMFKKLLGDEHLIKRYIDVFKTETPKMMQSLQDALGRNDFETVSIVSHSLKSQLIYFEDTASIELAKEMEYIADKEHGNQKERLTELMTKFEIHIGRLLADL